MQSKEQGLIASARSKVAGEGSRGILRLYVLHRLSKVPMSGYDLMSDLSSMTTGAWRPGPGSIYTILKDLDKAGYVKVRQKGIRSKQVYTITKEGEKALGEAKTTFDEYCTKRWHRVRGLMLDLVSPRSLAEMLNEGVKMQPDAWEKVLLSSIPKSERVFLLKENRLLAERHLEWVSSKLEGLQ